MTTLVWPDTCSPSTIKFQLITNTRMEVSQWTGGQVVQELIGAAWMAVMTFDSMTLAKYQLVRAWTRRLGGPTKRVLVRDYSYTGMQGGATGSIKATGNINAKRVTLSSIGGSSPAFLLGDLIQIGERLYQVSDDTVVPSGGSAVVNIDPPLRDTWVNADVVTTQPKCVMRLIDDNQDSMQAQLVVGSGTLTFREALP